jgi:histone deacetylase 1/2
VTELANLLIDVAKVAGKVKDVMPQYVEPKTFKEAWNHADPMQRAKWREAIRKEFCDMIKRKVWCRVKKSSIPSNQRCVKCKWVFKIKRNGVFRARLVACGYSQIPGVDFSESYSPVANDVTIRLLLVAMILFGLSAKIVDVETAFLYGELEKEVYMENPEGLEDSNDDEALLLLTTIYGLVQAARQYYKKAHGILRKIGFTGGDVDPCLFVKYSSLGIVFIALYVDDNLLVGHPKAIEDAIQQMKKHGLILKIEDDLKDYLSCEI